MDRLELLIKESNSFSQENINDVSEQLFSIFQINPDNIDNSIENRYEILDEFIDIVTKMLYSGFINEKRNKLKIVSSINQLKLQHELFELISSSDSDSKKLALMITANRFGNKCQSSVKSKKDQ